MPIFKDFAENGELLQIRFEELNDDNFLRYIKVNGIQQAAGYLEGLNDLTLEIEYGGYSCKLIKGEAKNIYGLDTFGKKIIKFNENKKQFLVEAEKLVFNVNYRDELPKSSHNFKPSPIQPLTFETLPLFIRERGIKATKGYFDCIADFSVAIENTVKPKLAIIPSFYSIGFLARSVIGEKNRFHYRAEKILTNFQQ